jgi:hypothetical protein
MNCPLRIDPGVRPFGDPGPELNADRLTGTDVWLDNRGLAGLVLRHKVMFAAVLERGNWAFKNETPLAHESCGCGGEAEKACVSGRWICESPVNVSIWALSCGTWFALFCT